MRYTRLIGISGAALLLWGCAQPAVDVAAEQAALRAAAEAYHQAGESGEFERMADFYHSGAVIMPPNAKSAEGPAGTREFFAGAGEMAGLALRFGEFSAEVAASGDMGYTLADVEITMDGPDGRPVTADERDLHVWRKEGGEWKIALDMWNTTEPMPEPSARSAAASGHPDAVAADPAHYSVEFENDQVRIVRVKYGPREKSVMHSHNPHAAVMLTDGNFRMHLPDGSNVEFPAEAGAAAWDDGNAHLPENLTDEPQEVVLVELK